MWAGVLFALYMVTWGFVIAIPIYVTVAFVMYWRDVQREKRER